MSFVGSPERAALRVFFSYYGYCQPFRRGLTAAGLRATAHYEHLTHSGHEELPTVGGPVAEFDDRLSRAHSGLHGRAEAVMRGMFFRCPWGRI